MFGTKSDDELLVCFLFAGFVEDTHVCLATIEGFGGFAKTTSESIVDESDFEDSCT